MLMRRCGARRSSPPTMLGRACFMPRSPLPKPAFADLVAGDADKAFAEAPVKIDAVFTTPPQHHNPMELLATVAEWREGTLIIHEGTQNAASIRHGLAHELGLDPDRVQVISPYAGGGFGQKNS